MRMEPLRSQWQKYEKGGIHELPHSVGLVAASN